MPPFRQHRKVRVFICWNARRHARGACRGDAAHHCKPQRRFCPRQAARQHGTQPSHRVPSWMPAPVRRQRLSQFGEPRKIVRSSAVRAAGLPRPSAADRAAAFVLAQALPAEGPCGALSLAHALPAEGPSGVRCARAVRGARCGLATAAAAALERQPKALPHGCAFRPGFAALFGRCCGLPGMGVRPPG